MDIFIYIATEYLSLYHYRLSGLLLQPDIRFFLDLVKFFMYTLETRVHMTFYLLTKVYIVSGNQGTHDKLNQIHFLSLRPDMRPFIASWNPTFIHYLIYGLLLQLDIRFFNHYRISGLESLSGIRIFIATGYPALNHYRISGLLLLLDIWPLFTIQDIWPFIDIWYPAFYRSISSLLSHLDIWPFRNSIMNIKISGI